jgi:hypothetical protein
VGIILVAAVAIIATIATAGVAATAFGATGGIFASGTAALTGAGGLGLTGLGAAVIGGAVGSAVSQGVAIAAGLQKGFDFKGVALGAIGAGVTAGLGTLASGSNVLSSAFKAIGGSNPYVQAGLHGATASALTQGIGVATGLQSSFSWREVGVSSLASATGAAIASDKGGLAAAIGLKGSAGIFANRVASGIGGSLVRRAFGSKTDTATIIADAFGSAIGDSVVEGLSTLTPAQRRLLPDRERSRALPKTAAASVALIVESELGGVDFDLSDLPVPTLGADPSGRRGVVEITNLSADDAQTSGGFGVGVIASPGFSDASVPLAFQLGGPVASPLAVLAREGGLTDYVYINGVVTASADTATGNFVPGPLDTRTQLLPGALNGLLDRGSLLLANDSTNPELPQIAEYLSRLDADVKAGDVATIAAVYGSDAAAVDANFRRGDFSIESRTYERLAALRPALFGPSPFEGTPRLGNVLADFGILSLTGAIGGIAGVGAFSLLGSLGVRASIALPASSQIGNLIDQGLRNAAYVATDGYAGQSGINGVELGLATGLPLALYGGGKAFEKLENAVAARVSKASEEIAFGSTGGGSRGSPLNPNNDPDICAACTAAAVLNYRDGVSLERIFLLQEEPLYTARNIRIFAGARAKLNRESALGLIARETDSTLVQTPIPFAASAPDGAYVVTGISRNRVQLRGHVVFAEKSGANYRLYDGLVGSRPSRQEFNELFENVRTYFVRGN